MEATTNIVLLDERERRRLASLRYRWRNIEKVRTYARERMRAKRAADPDGVRGYDKTWRAANIERVRRRSREWWKNNPHKVRETKLKCTYGLTTDDWNKLFTSQGSRCAICGVEQPNGKGIWHTDHCHTTKKVRGILCSFCNSMLGYSKDSEATLKAAAEYLHRSK